MMRKIILVAIIGLSLSQFSLAIVSEQNLQKLSKYYTMAQVITNDPWVYYNLAMAYAYTGYVEEGFHALAEIPKIDENFKQKVIRRYSRKIRRDPENWEHQFYYAFALYFNEDKSGAVQAFEKVVELTDDSSIKGWSYGYIAYIMGEMKKWEKALYYINKAIEKEPAGAALYFAKSIALKETGDKVGAAQALLKAGVLQAKQILLKRKIQTDEN